MSESQSAENHSKSNNNFQTMDMDTRRGHHVRKQGKTKDSESCYIKHEHP